MYPNEFQLNELANRIREAGRVPTKPNVVGDPRHGVRATPDIGRIHIAVEGGHISAEEGADLNPRYKPENKRYNSTQASKIRARERDPEGERSKRHALYQKRKARLNNGGN